MKILQIHNSYNYYGGEDSVVDEEKNLLEKNGHEVIQLFRDNKKELITLKDKFEALKNLSYSEYSIKLLSQKLLEIGNPDIVHIHNTFPLWTYSIFKFLHEKQIPIIMTLHNYRLVWDTLKLFDKNYLNYGCFKNSQIKTFLISKIINKNKKLLNNVNKFITLTEFTRGQFIRAGISKERLAVKPNFLPKKKIILQNIENKNNAIFASRISEEKGITTLINAWNEVDLKINIFGDGPLLAGFKKDQINIQFHGNCPRDAVNEEIKKSKFLIFPSEWYECMPMTILEAFREGTLVLASNIGSIKCIIKDNYNGILFNPKDTKDIQNKVNWVLNNPQKCNEICSNALNDFNMNYTEEINYKMLMNIYNEAISKCKIKQP